MLQRVMSLNFQEAVQIVPTSNTIFFFITSGQNIIDYTTV